MSDDFYPSGKGVWARLRLAGLLFVVILGTALAVSWIKGGDPLTGINMLADAVVNFFKALF